MKKLIFRNLIIFFLVVSIWSCKEKKKEKPNILFIFADDQVYNTIHALGNEEIQTPNLDKLVQEGTSFTHAYNMGAWHGAVCVASRTMLVTGEFLWNARESESNLDSLAGENHLWSQMLSEQGYDTYFSGKWHVKVNADSVFDHTRHIRPGMPETVPEAYNRPVKGEEPQWSPYDKSLGGFWEGGKHWSEVLGDDAKDFLQNASQQEDPFFMYLAFNAPHDPRQSPKKFVDMYPREDIKVPENFMPEYPFKEEIGSGEDLRDERLAPFPRTEYAVKTHRQEYYAIISHMDRQIGRILKALEESGKADNTYIFFTADHGLACGHHGLMGKQNMYDHSVRAPLIVVGPDIPKDRKLDMNVYLQDIMPTTLNLAGMEKPEYVEFSSLLPNIRGERNSSAYDNIYGGYRDLQRMIRDDEYKLIAYPAAEELRLYNISKDPLEMDDLADEPEQQERIERMFHELEELSVQMGDTLKLGKYFPEI
ncbi:MAG: sulfatase-like hydrolase/transferase [Bacteroidota bacterium]